MAHPLPPLPVSCPWVPKRHHDDGLGASGDSGSATSLFAGGASGFWRSEAVALPAVAFGDLWLAHREERDVRRLGRGQPEPKPTPGRNGGAVLVVWADGGADEVGVVGVLRRVRISVANARSGALSLAALA